MFTLFSGLAVFTSFLLTFTCLALVQQLRGLLCKRCPEAEVPTLNRQLFERYVFSTSSFLVVPASILIFFISRTRSQVFQNSVCQTRITFLFKQSFFHTQMIFLNSLTKKINFKKVRILNHLLAKM